MDASRALSNRSTLSEGLAHRCWTPWPSWWLRSNRSRPTNRPTSRHPLAPDSKLCASGSAVPAALG